MLLSTQRWFAFIPIRLQHMDRCQYFSYCHLTPGVLHEFFFLILKSFSSTSTPEHLFELLSIWNEAQHHQNQRKQFLFQRGRLHLALSKYPGKAWQGVQWLFNCSSLSCCLTPELAAAKVTIQPAVRPSAAGCALSEIPAPCFRLSWAFAQSLFCVRTKLCH